PATASNPAYLVVNRNDGEIDRLDFDGDLRTILAGASRGDLVTVGPDHCIYANLQDRVIKIGPSAGFCNFAPPAEPASQEVLGTRRSRHVADLRLTGRGVRSARRSPRLTYKLTVRNAGPGTAHAVVFTYRLAKGLRTVSARSVRGRARCSR